MPEIQGHRGARALRPENTIPGLAYALAIGVDVIEFDITLSADNGLILAHDLTVDPQTIRGNEHTGARWRALTLDQIATLDAGYREPVAPYAQTFTAVPSTPVPTLDDVCHLVGGLGAHVVLAIDVKAEPSWPSSDIELLTSGVLTTLASHGLSDQARILAFDWRILRAARRLAPDVTRVALVEPRGWVPGSSWLAGLDPADYGAAGPAGAARGIDASWISPDDVMVTAELIDSAHREQLQVSVWTINDMARAAELIGWGIDGIVTDRPDLLRALLAAHGEPLPRGYGEVRLVLPRPQGAVRAVHR